MTPEQAHALEENGYTVLSGFMDRDRLDRLRFRVNELFAAEGENAGAEFKQEPGCQRLANLADKGEVFLGILSEPAVLGCVKQVLGPAIKLSSLNARRVRPHSNATQPLHADMDALPDEKGYWVCNVLWMLDDFTPENGPLRVVPGSHRYGQRPREALADPRAPHPDQETVLGPGGSVIVMNAHLWHGGLPNTTDHSRTAVHAFYARRDRPQQQYQRKLLRPAMQAALSPALRGLLALDDPWNDQISRDVAVRSGFMK